ncbi:glycogen binding subunit 76A [Leptinotarsa decemlineata]|uniref:glycogen binding subunit 76A n=1 Tax=Leptinotarsa decemlineata TaxID=7539 RepID=UPI003D307F45
MSSEGQKCGLGSLLSMSCRGRAEAFARSLQSRLRSLGSHDDNGSSNEGSWLAANENQVAISQPRHNLDLDLDLESPASPVPETEEDERTSLINRDNLHVNISNLRHSHSNDCQCPSSKEHQQNFSRISNSNDSDSDCSFYDTENDVEQRLGGFLNGDISELSISQDTISTTQDETFATTSDCTPQPTSSSSLDASTLSLRDEDCTSLEINGSLADISKVYKTGNENTEFNGSTPDTIEKEETNDSERETYVSQITVEKELLAEFTNKEEVTPEIVVNSSFSSAEFESSAVEDDDEDTEKKSPRVRRCSSLKTGKTPPSTPGGKKIVRFADVLGLDLADVRTFLDEIPKIPVSAYVDLPEADLYNTSNSLSPSNLNGPEVGKFLMPLFQQPGGLPNFLDLVRENQVCLENALFDDPVTLSISGTVRVRNLDFHKSLHIRYSLDSWKTFADVQGTYVNNSCDGFSDRFSFRLYAHTLSIGERIEFACRFQCRGCQYWDNNRGANYCFQCLPSHSSSSRHISPLDDWGASFY